jgi:hypothetical protein
VQPGQDGPRQALRSVAHDLGNLSYRLIFFSGNLRAQVPDMPFRAEAIALLEDPTSRLRHLIQMVRNVEEHV